ncbi:hypothetical protein CAEBREN_12641 [Caenorhabditis brenneri]|uniref:Uncharacterized protein n=1 Tax=Caenorhabditis brenneri TaxID=135651 RepID=G0MG76_CAEBE|nr:hypothetical protein CAEBREN_12641 [Caenorhabditis brenneri]
MNFEGIKKQFRIFLAIWTAFMIVGSTLFIYNVRETLVLFGNSVMILWMLLFFLVSNDTEHLLMFVLKAEIFILVSFSYATCFFSLFYVLFDHKIFGKHGQKAYMFNSFGMLVHFVVFLISRPGSENRGNRIAGDQQLEVRRAFFDDA